ncbi:helix-turn-helix domain-containing protein [Arthrobacter sp. zg-Y1171]|nr:helix-turn-helix domain-containing protein [Arthrobacter sp. zg-Y1171]MCQ1994531.1 helix-turn-helix domain-containing protein [Arthrobacter sp. zg-Y1171]UWX81387.1 helix-turn-helix domain-containing protein [Arthrobacter sp. zg-Y1171]
MVSLHKSGQRTTAEIAEQFKVARSTAYRIIQRTPWKGASGAGRPKDV